MPTFVAGTHSPIWRLARLVNSPRSLAGTFAVAL